MRQLSLDIAAWTVKAVGDLSAVPAALRHQQVPAIVPGCVHTDLIRARLIPDPLVGMNEREVQWIGETDWEYRASLEADADLLKHERVDLVCDGLDTITEIRLNGVDVGRAANMFHPHRFDLRPALRPGPNDLTITFRSPLKHIRAEEKRLGKRPVNGDWDPYIFIRKAACNFGWDWAPKLATSGIWQATKIEAWDTARIDAMCPVVSRRVGDEWTVEVNLHVELSRNDLDLSTLEASAAITTNRSSHHNEVWREPNLIRLSDAWVRAPRRNFGLATITLSAKDPALWWPRGYGRPARYDLCAKIYTDRTIPRVPAATLVRSIGFREVKLKTPPDAHGSAFTFEINGREVFCKGANWIPEGPWPGQVTRETYRERLKQAAGANMNMLRVWGGGYYESDAFYELCDELGIMVWQDFMFACAMYPEEEPYPTLIEAEARHQVSRLSSHPSIVLWCGGNECTWAHDAWGNAPGEKPWKERLEGKTWGEGYYLDLLPRLMKELDPTRPYWPNSPWPGSKDTPPNNADHGDRHTWDQRGDGYRKLVPRFCSEFGHQSPSNYATLARVLAPEDLKIGSPALEHRQRATGGTARHINEAIAETFRPPRDFDEWHYLAQLTQSRAIKTGLEWMRVNRPCCMGALIWQLNDCWPGMSWSLVDSDGRPKLAYYAAQDAFRDRLITIQPFDGRPWLCVVNDEDRPARYLMDVRRMTFDGDILATKSIEASCPTASAARTMDLLDLVGPPKDPTREFIIAETIGRRALWFFLPDRELRYPQPQFEFTRRNNGAKSTWVIRARTLIRDMVLTADGIAVKHGRTNSSTAAVTMLIGDEIDLQTVDTEYMELVSSLVKPPAFLCANMFGAAP